MKKLILNLFCIFGAIFICGYIFCGMFASGTKPQFSDLELVGKNKEEIICLLFKNSEKTKNGEVRIAVVNPNNSITSYYFKRTIDAKANHVLMKSSQWLCFFTRGSFTFNGKVMYYKLSFENEKVISVQLGSYKDSM